jgi:DNA repair protein RecO (recombination protein O)
VRADKQSGSSDALQMPLYETESLVLKSHNLAEADRIVVFYTREHGIVRGVAKGAKRLKSKFGSTLEPFSIVNLEYFQKEERELVSIQRVEMVRSSFDAASDPAFLRTYSYLADLLTSFAPPHDPNETLYRMVRACLDLNPKDDDELRAIRLYFELWLLRLGGYLPEWNECNRCRRVLSSLESVEMDAEARLICGNCSTRQGNKAIAPLLREVFHNVQKLSPAGFLGYSAEKSDMIAELSTIMKRLITAAIGHDKPMERSSV